MKHAEERNCLVPLKQLVGTVVSSGRLAASKSRAGAARLGMHDLGSEDR